jgi:predicted nucleic acid-binding protein
MASSTLEQVHPGERIFIDAPIFIYHFTGASTQCRDFLTRCETGEVQGVTSVVTLAEVTHRLMMIEAVMKGLVSPGNVVQKLRKKPDVVRALALYQEQVEKICLMDIEILALDLSVLESAGPLRSRHGLLTNDSLVLSAARSMEISAIASADRDFARLDEVMLFYPDDI